MKLPLLTIVQRVLGSMDSDFVDDINATEESIQVADVAQEVYLEWITAENWPFNKRLLRIDALNDADRPNYLKVKDNYTKITEFKYNKEVEDDDNIYYRLIHYREPDEFLRTTYGRNSTEDNVIVVQDFGGVELLIKNDANPTIWTSFDDTHIVTDSFDLSVEATLQQSKAQVLGYVIPEFTINNDFVPDLPEHLFPAYLADVKARCHLYFKNQASPKDERIAFAGFARLLKEAKVFREESGLIKGYGRR